MSLEHRVKKLEDETDKVMVVSFIPIFGGIFYGDCKRYQDESCKRIEKSEPLNIPEGAKIKFIPALHDPKETDPCDGCADFEKASGAEQGAGK